MLSRHTPLRSLGRNLLWRRPKPYYILARLFQKNIARATRDYDLVIDGFPRSGNTFLSELMRLAHPGLRILSHVHNPAMILDAVENRIPVLFLIRNPKESILSWHIFTGWPIAEIARSWLCYHQALIPVLPRLLVIHASDIFSNHYQVLENISTHLKLPNPDPNHPGLDSDAIFKRCEQIAPLYQGAPSEKMVSRPSSWRTSQKSRIAESGMSPEVSMLFKKADFIHQKIAKLPSAVPCGPSNILPNICAHKSIDAL